MIARQQNHKGGFVLTIYVIMNSLIVTALLLASCAQAVTEEEEATLPPVEETAPQGEQEAALPPIEETAPLEEEEATLPLVEEATPPEEIAIEGPYFGDIGDEVVFTVRDTDGKPIAGASVDAFGATGITDEKGQVAFSLREAGAFAVRVSIGESQGKTVLQVYPRGRDDIPIRGLRWRTRPHFETPHTMRTSGANYIQFKADYYIDNDFNLIPLVFTACPSKHGQNFMPASAEEMKGYDQERD